MKSLWAAKKNERRSPTRSTIETRGLRGLDVGDTVGQRERDFLHRRRARLADVVAADRDRVPAGQLTVAPRQDVRRDPEGMTRRIDVRAACDVLLQHVVLNRARERAERHAAAPGDRHVEREQNHGRRVDRHRARHAIERNLVEQGFHVLDRVDRDADTTDFAGRHGVIRVESHLRRQVERDAQSGDARSKQVAEPCVRLRGGAESRVLAHRPQTIAIHRGLNAAREREHARFFVAGLDRTCDIRRAGRTREPWAAF